MKRMVTKEEIETLVPKLYRHSVAVKSDDCSLGFIFINSDPTEYDDVGLTEELHGNDVIAPINGAVKVGAGYLIVSYAVFNEADNDFYLRGMSNSGNIETGSTQISLMHCITTASYIVDDVKEIK